jgi:hypothetical protein
MNDTEFDSFRFQMIGTGRRDGKGNEITRLQPITWFCRALVDVDVPAPDEFLSPGACQLLCISRKELVEALTLIMDAGTESLCPLWLFIHSERCTRSREDLLQISFDLFLLDFFRKGYFLHQESPCRIQHFSFAEREFLFHFQCQQVPVHLRDFVD